MVVLTNVQEKETNLWVELYAVKAHLLVVDGGDEMVRRLCAYAEPVPHFLHAIAVCKKHWLQFL